MKLSPPFQVCLKINCGIVPLLVLSLLLGNSYSKAYEVKNCSGRPQILEDGVPVSPWMFYGYTSVTRPGSLALDQTWKQGSFEFVAPGNDDNMVFHFRFGEEPGSVQFDEIQMRDVTSGNEVFNETFEKGQEKGEKWRDWRPVPDAPVTWSFCEGKKGRGIEISIGEPGLNKDKRLAGFHLILGPFRITQGHVYHFEMVARCPFGSRGLRVDAKHQGGDFRSYGGIKPPLASQLRLASNNGVRFVSFDAPMTWGDGGETAAPDRAFRACDEVLDAYPQALLIPRLSVEPPDFWRKTHPGELVQFEDGKLSPHASVASDTFKKEAGNLLRRTINALENRYPNSMAGYHITGQNTGEWFYPEAWAWRQVGFENPLQEKWEEKNQGIFFDAKNRRDDGAGAFLDPSRDRSRIVFNQFLQDELSEALLGFARVVREEVGNRRLILAFYGYSFTMPTYPNGAAATGHMALGRLLKSSDIDIFCGPIAYMNRQVGGGGLCMAPAESMAASGKMWLQEDDTSGVLARDRFFEYPGWKSGPTNWPDTLSVVRRNLGQTLTRGFATWWMDLGATGWWDDPKIWKPMGELKGIQGDYLKQKLPFQPEIALIVDEASALNMANSPGARAAQRSLMNSSWSNVSLVGAPFGQWLLEDAQKEIVKGKLQIFVNAFKMGPPESVELRKSILSQKVNVVWLWAPGYLNHVTATVDGVQTLTGFRVHERKEVSSPEVTSSPYGVSCGLPKKWGMTNEVTPLFVPKPENSDLVLARYTLGGEPAVVLRQEPNGAYTLFCGVPELPVELALLMVEKAGIHRYINQLGHVWSDGSFLSVHTMQGGPLFITFPRKGQVRDLITGTLETGARFSRNAQPGETHLFYQPK